MELKKGMYVRYTRGAINGYVPPKIAKVLDCSDNELIKIDNRQCILRSDVIKASSNIIDLIEVGDYVNGDLVTFISSNPQKNQKGKHSIILNDSYSLFGKYENIKSIVTKEQFDAIKYEVE